MLCVTWDAMNAAIPRLRAEAAIDLYTVMVAASPYAGESGQKIVEGWWATVRKGAGQAAEVARVTWRSFGRIISRVLENYGG